MVFLLTLLLFVYPAFGATIIVPDEQGTINGAIAVANPNDTILVRDGTYNEQVSISKNSLTLQSENQYGAVIDAQNTRDYGITGSQNNIDNIVIDGFEVKNALHGCISVISGGRNSDNWTIKNNKIHHCYRNGIEARGQSLTVQDNIIYLIGNHQETMGILVHSDDGTVIERNQIMAVSKNPIRVAGSVNDGSSNVLVRDNIIGHANNCMASNHADGGNEFYNNYIYDCESGFVVKHNKCILGQNQNYEQFYHNTIYRFMNRGAHMGQNQPPLDCARIKNNVFDSGDFLGFSNFSVLENNSTNIEVDGNFHDRGDSNVPIYQNDSSDTFQNTLAQVRNNTPYEDNGREGNATIINHTSGIHYNTLPLAGPDQGTAYGTQVGARGLIQTFDYVAYITTMTALSATKGNSTRGRLTDFQAIPRWLPGDPPVTIIFELDGGADVTFSYFEYSVAANSQGPIKEFTLDKAENSGGPWTEILDANATDTTTQGGKNWYEFTTPVTTKYLRFTIQSVYNVANGINIGDVFLWNWAQQDAAPSTYEVEQKAFRFYGRELAEGVKPLNTENQSISAYCRGRFTLRTALEASGGSDGESVQGAPVSLYARRCTPTCGTWGVVDNDADSANGVYIIDHPNRTDGEALNNLLTLGGATYDPTFSVFVDDGSSPSRQMNLSSGEHAELEWNLGITTPVCEGETIQLRVEQTDGTDLDTYTAVPAVFIATPSGTTGNAGVIIE